MPLTMYVRIISCKDPAKRACPPWYHKSIGKIVKVYKDSMKSSVGGFDVYRIVNWRKVLPIDRLDQEEGILIGDCVTVLSDNKIKVRSIRCL